MVEPRTPNPYVAVRFCPPRPPQFRIFIRKFMQKSPESFETNKDDALDEKYDGFYFIPVETEDEISYNLAFFNFKDDMANAVPVESSEMGDKFHIVFFKQNEDGVPNFDETFEAILGDPIVYINNLIGSNMSGCILRKTTKSQKWFDDYIHYIVNGEFDQRAQEFSQSK